MKKLFLIILIFFCLDSFCQSVILSNTGSVVLDNTGNVVLDVPRLIVDSLSVRPYGVYSARKTTKYYSGFCIKLRRSADNAESNFGFGSNNIVDTASIRIWKGASTLYVVTLYDQMGLYNLTQAVAINQPTFDDAKINGVLTKYLATVAYSVNLAQPNTFIIVGASPAFMGVNQNWNSGFAINNIAFRVTSTNTWGINFGTALFSLNNANTNLHMLRTLANGVNSAHYVDEVLDVTGNAGVNTLDGLTLGCAQGGILGMNGGYYYEFYIFDNTPTANDLLILKNNIKRTWGTP